MASTPQTACDTYRVIIPRRNVSEILLSIEGRFFALPRLAIPPRQRVAGNLQEAARAKWQREIICLFAPTAAGPSRQSSQEHFEVLEFRKPEEAPPLGTDWVRVRSLARKAFRDPLDFSVIQQSLAECQGCREGTRSGPFGKPGWFKGLTEWVHTEIAAHRLRLTGPFRQLNASPSFSLVRFETDGPAVWFKAVGPPNTCEFPLTILLAERFPHFLPRILGTLPAWNGWLSTEAEGEELSGASRLTLWQAAASELASLQIASIGKASPILCAGARDLRAAVLLELVGPFLTVTGALMQAQEKASPPPLSLQELLVLGEQLKEAIARMRRCPIPDTLAHLDFNPGNIFVSPERATFLDWAEGSVGNPLLTFQYLLEHFRKSFGRDTGQEVQLIRAYTERWRELMAPADVSEALSLAPLLAAFAYAAASLSSRESQTPQVGEAPAFLRALARRMKHEADRYFEPRTRCQFLPDQSQLPA